VHGFLPVFQLSSLANQPQPPFPIPGWDFFFCVRIPSKPPQLTLLFMSLTRLDFFGRVCSPFLIFPTRPASSFSSLVRPDGIVWRTAPWYNSMEEVYCVNFRFWPAPTGQPHCTVARNSVRSYVQESYPPPFLFERDFFGDLGSSLVVHSSNLCGSCFPDSSPIYQFRFPRAFWTAQTIRISSDPTCCSGLFPILVRITFPVTNIVF